MFSRPVNVRALFLCLLVVLALGYAILNSTVRYRPGLQVPPARTVEFQPAFNVPDAVPPDPGRVVRPPPIPSPVAPTTARDLSGPDIVPTAAPGVAFTYRYAFRLAAQRIGEVQEQHARACEQLGVHRCRITGMRYRVADDRSIEAMLTVKLEPGLARRFGQSGTAAVVRAEGEMVQADISGIDAGATIGSATRDIVQMREDLLRLEQRLAGRGLSTGERSSLEYEAQQLRSAIRSAEAGRDAQRESLATTPLVFQYVSAEVAADATRPSFVGSAQRAFGNFLDGIAVLFAILVTLLPWILLALGLWGLARLIGRRFQPAAKPTEPALGAA